MILKETFATLLDILAPLRCPLCERKLDERERCRTCALPDPRLVIRQLKPGPCLFLAGGALEGLLRRLVHAFKYGRDPGAEALLLAQMWHALPPGIRWDHLVPVPAHPVRIRERGFAATLLLARRLAGRTGIPVNTALERSHYTPSLTGYGAAQRHGILAGALRAHGVSGSLLLIDDVVTTAATYRACRRVLLGAGATSVDLLAAAQTPRPESSPPRRIVAGAPL